MSEPDYAAEMRLPEGKTCADCIHGPRCDGLFGAVRRGFTACDFWPNLYRPLTVGPLNAGGVVPGGQMKPPQSEGQT